MAPLRHAAAAVFALALLCSLAGRAQAQQPATKTQQPQPARADQAASQAQQPPTRTPEASAKAGASPAAAQDPRTRILEKLRRLDARPDTVRGDSAAAADSVVTLAAPTPGAARPSAAAASTSIQQDSMMKALGQLSGFTATLYAGKSARFAADTGRLTLTGPAQVAQGAQAMSADSTLVYNQKTQIACGYGKPVLTGAGQSDPVQSDQVCYDVQKRMGVAFGAKTKFQEGATAWYVDGKQVYLNGNSSGQTLFGSDAEFTDCDLAQPHYHFTARKMKIIRNDVLVARDVTLSFADVPVFWLPFMMQSMKQGRRSGILMPRFGLNDIARTSVNYERRVQNLGFYWAINDHLGALAAMDWFSGNYTALNSSFDYSFRRQFLNGSLAFNRYWMDNGDGNLTLSTQDSWQPDERTSINASVNYASSSSFVLQQSFDPNELTRNIDSNVGLQRRFDFGSLTLSARRSQVISSGRVALTLPNASLSLVPITLLQRADGQPLLTWNGGSASFESDGNTAGNYAIDASPSTRNTQASFSTGLRLGNLSWSQSVGFTRNSTLDRPAFQTMLPGQDTVSSFAEQPGFGRQSMTWSTSLSYQQRLIGTSSISPSLSIGGQSAQNDSAGVSTGMVAAPTRIHFGASTQMDIYGFWPGVGPFSKIRHKLSPSFTYTYSPAPSGTPSELQQEVFGLGPGSAISEDNTLSIGLNQTFEAKYKENPKSDSAQAQSAADTTGSLDGEPRRLPQARKITLLSIRNSAVVYNFARWDSTNRRIGFNSPSLSTTLSSDLIPGIQISLQHDLFQDVDPKDPASQGGPRRFSPYLTNASTSFSLNSNSGLFRMLGRLLNPGSTRSAPSPSQPDTTSAQPAATGQTNNGLGLNLIPGSVQQQTQTPASSGGAGSWSARFTYNLTRQRPALPMTDSLGNPIPIYSGPNGSQMISGSVSFHPTPAWSVSWQTGYNITQHQFASQSLTLTRDLHQWQANFSFVKGPNGNFSFDFHVSLKAEPDLKFDYHQNSPGPGGYYPGY